jgi:putative hydrolase of HD superfamily
VRGANPTLLDLLLELETLDRIPRSGYLLRGVTDCESVAEHSYHLALIVRLLAAREPGLDRSRAVELALVHDLAELRIGDLPRTGANYFAAGAKHGAERLASAEILAPADAELAARYEEYERGESREARFVRACDKLQLMVKVAVYQAWGQGALSEFWRNPENFPDQEFAAVAETFASLRARVGAAIG